VPEVSDLRKGNVSNAVVSPMWLVQRYFHKNGNMSSQLPRCEARRLGLQEADWNIAGKGPTRSRTRGGGNGRPSLHRESLGHVETVVLSDTTESEDAAEDQESAGEEEETGTVVPKAKPTHSRVIVEVAHLHRAFANYPCPTCEEPLELKIRTMCIASSLELVCNNKDCPYICDFERPIQTTIHSDDKHHYERMTDYAANVLYVLGFISCGDGCTEAGRLLGLMGLPNDTTMMNRSFGIIEERIGRFVRRLCEDIIVANIDEEAKLSMNEFDYTVWKTWLDSDQSGPMPVASMPQLQATYDMAWQQKGSGHQYNSQSGHGSLFGRYSRKLIGLVIKCKVCHFCNAFNKKHPEGGLDVPFHHCWKNHEGSSGSMESIGAVELIVEAFEKRKVVISRLCCDDDSSIRADCQWSNTDYLKNYGLDTLPKVPISKGINKGKQVTRPT
jgi:hypothetical protein